MFVYHVATELVVEKMSRHMSRKQIEQNSTIGTLMVVGISIIFLMTKKRCCNLPEEPPCPASHPWLATAIGSPAEPSTQPMMMIMMMLMTMMINKMMKKMKMRVRMILTWRP